MTTAFRIAPLPEDAMDFVLTDGVVTAEVVKRASTADLLLVLPLALLPPVSTAVHDMVQMRIGRSRVLKLRFLLLTGHDAYNAIRVRRRFRSSAYGEEEEDEGSSEGVGVFEVDVDVLDLQSVGFYEEEVFRKVKEKGKGAVGAAGTLMMVGHVFSGGDIDDSEVYGQWVEVLERRGRRVVGLRRLSDGEEEAVEREQMEVVRPLVRVRGEEAGLKAVIGQLLMRLCGSLWAGSEQVFGEAARAPFCGGGDCALTRGGLLELEWDKFVPVGEFNFDYWRYTKGLNPVVADSVTRSAAGVYVVMYVFGLMGEMGMVREVFYMGEVGGVFEQGGRAVVAAGLREALKALGFWDAFWEASVKGFGVLRERYAEVLAPLWGLIEAVGVSRAKVLQFVTGRHALNLMERDRRNADALFRKWVG
eukprot:GFKZ01012522.1.p1 GENE.GFKZ01012522.1~~GFKZ01012522.1.p1  ORF type:complete len:418 (+),score=68.70 GFKZ01012522.1:93-1346(+)